MKRNCEKKKKNEKQIKETFALTLVFWGRICRKICATHYRVCIAVYSVGRNRLSLDALAAERIRFHQLSRRAWNFGS
jgi:hypothetical protein